MFWGIGLTISERLTNCSEDRIADRRTRTSATTVATATVAVSASAA